MARVVVLGGGVCGLAAGLLLARDEHEVTVLERDEEPVPESAEQSWESWSRGGVTQFRQAHYLQPAGRAVLEQELPDIFAALIAAGAGRLDILARMPPALADRPRESGDERFVALAARRSTIEQVLAKAADAQPGLEVRRGLTVTELTVEGADGVPPEGVSPEGVPHVTGVRVDSGETLRADLVVDATGRRSQLPNWLSDARIGPMYEESEDSGFIYYTRFFRSVDGTTPRSIAPPLTSIGTFSILTLPADNDTWSVTAYISSGDRPLKRMRDPGPWASVIEACPLHAHWLAGEPISDVTAMGGVVDRYRRPTSDGRPLLTGLALLGDAWACTNPSLGRGITLGLLHAQSLRDLLGSHLDDPLELAQAWDAITEQRLTPWYRQTVEQDRERLLEIEALRDGLEPPQPSESSAVLRRALIAAMPHDPELFRAFLDSACCFTPLRETFAQAGTADRILELAADREPMPMPGPNREELLRLLD